MKSKINNKKEAYVKASPSGAIVLILGAVCGFVFPSAAKFILGILCLWGILSWLFVEIRWL